VIAECPASVGSTPVHAEIIIPPSTTGSARFACTASTCASSGFGSGKPCTLVATYVAIEMKPSDTNSTSVYVLPTGVCSALVSRSVTEVMMFVCISVGSIHKKVATMASPTCGFVGLNPFTLVERPVHLIEDDSAPRCVESSGPRGHAPQCGGGAAIERRQSRAGRILTCRESMRACLRCGVHVENENDPV